MHVSLRRGSLVGAVATNVGARVVALAALAVATIFVARSGGSADVGVYTLLRILPGLAGVLAAAGLPGALAFFLAGPTRSHPRLWATLTAVMLAGGVLGAVVWAVASPVLLHVFFRGESLALVAAAGVAVLTQLVMTTGKAALQGLQDLRGANLVIASEELAFLPVYGLGWWVGLRGMGLVLVGLVVADLLVAVQAWGRIARRGAIHGSWRPSLQLGREMCSYGMRGQLGGVVSLMSLRLDFAILGALAGPAVLGTYAVASKYAELLRLPGLALTWVLYPRIARGEAADFAARRRRLLALSVGALVACAVPLAVAAPLVLPLLYGSAFSAAVVPTLIILAGLAVGLAVTVALDLALIPSFGAIGASVASAIAYVIGDGVLVALFMRVASRGPVIGPGPLPGAAVVT